MNNIITTQASKLGELFGVAGDGRELVEVLKATAFKGDVSDAQMAALMLVANQYGLNPFTKELFAFPDKNNGVIPVVGVDGWARIINNHQQFDGMEFENSPEVTTMNGAKLCPEWIECRIYRKDRSRPTAVREYLDEVYRPPFKGKYGEVNGPWQSHTKRFLRHKAMIQCARIAFGYGGIYDQDEAERIVEDRPTRHMVTAEVIDGTTGEVLNKQEAPRGLPLYTDAQLEKNLPTWQKSVDTGKTTADKIIAKVTSGYRLTPEHEERIRAMKKQWQPTEEELAETHQREMEESGHEQGEQQ